MIKTVRKEEMRMLLDLMPTYYHHCISNPDTLLTRFYGVHRVKPMSGSHVRASYGPEFACLSWSFAFRCLWCTSRMNSM